MKNGFKILDSDMHLREPGDLWDKYMDAYQDVIRHTATNEAPWYVVPADHKWFMHAVVSSTIVDTLDSLKLSYPTVDEERRRALKAAMEQIMSRKSRTRKI